MAENPIRKEEIIDGPGIRNDLQGVLDDLLKLAVVLKEDIVTAAKAAREGVDQFDVTTTEGRKQLKQTSKEVTDLSKQYNSLTRVITQLTKEQQKGAAEADKSGKSYNSLNARLKELTAQFKATGDQGIQRKLLPQITKLRAEVSKMDAMLGNHTRNVGNYKSAWMGAGKTILAAAGIVGGATMVLRTLFNVIKSGFKTSIDFEYNMSQVKAITRATGDEFESLRQNAIALGSATRYTASEVALLQKEYAKLGFTTNEILNITRATLDLAAATGSDLAYAATIAGSTLRQFQLDATQMQHVVDVMTLSFSSSALDMDKFATSMQHAGPVAKAVGEDIESTSAKLAVLANAGLDASISGTSLRNIYLELERRGLTFDQAMNKINSSQNEASASLELFGKRGATAGIILAENTEKIKEFDLSFRNADGSAKEMADTMLNNVRGSAIILKSAWEGLILRTNESEGALKGFLDTLTAVVSAINTKGKPAIDSMFETRQINTFMDKWRFYAASGIGFWQTLTNSLIRSKKFTQEWSDTISKSYTDAREEEDRLLQEKLKAEAEEKRIQEEKLKAIQAAVEAEEKAAAERLRLQRKEISQLKEINFLKNPKAQPYDPMKALDEQLDRTQAIEQQLADIHLQNIQKQQGADEANAEFQKALNLEVTNEKIQDWIEANQRYLDIAQGATEVFSNILQSRKQKELSAVGDNAVEREKIEKKYAKKEQTLSIAKAIINGAQGITKTFAELGWPAGILGAALIAAITASQIAVIASQKFAEGGYTGEGLERDDTGKKIAGVVHEREYVIPEAPTRKYRALIEAIHHDDPMAIAEELRSRKFSMVWGGIQPKLTEAYKQDPYTRLMYELMKNNISSYPDSDGNTVLVYADGTVRIIKK